MNFYLFLLISPRFRHQVKHLFVKKGWNYLTRLCNARLTVRTNNQVAPETAHGAVSIVESV